MSYSVDWYLEPHILYNRLAGEISAEDIMGLDRETLICLKNTPHLVHIIHDDTLSQGALPFDLRTFRDLIQALRQPNLGWLIYIKEGDATSQFVTAVVSHMFRLKMKRVASVELALAFLETHYPDLAPLLDNR